MEEKKFIQIKKQEFGIKEYIKRDLGKGKISKLDIEYTPVGEKIIILTSRPGLVIGRKGEKISSLTSVLKNRFKLENPHIEIKEIENPLFDAQLVADEIAMALERMGNLKFKVIAYRKLQEIISAGALGCEIKISGKLPSERARPWRFASGYLKKAGDSRKEVDRAETTALTKTGMIGIKVAIMSPSAKIYDKIDIDEKLLKQINTPLGENIEQIKKVKESEKPKENIKRKVKPVKVKKNNGVAENKKERGVMEKEKYREDKEKNMDKKEEKGDEEDKKEEENK